MSTDPTGKRVEERIYASQSKGEIIYRLGGPVTKAEADDVPATAVKDEPLRMELCHRDVSDGYRM